MGALYNPCSAEAPMEMTMYDSTYHSAPCFQSFGLTIGILMYHGGSILHIRQFHRRTICQNQHGVGIDRQNAFPQGKLVVRHSVQALHFAAFRQLQMQQD